MLVGTTEEVDKLNVAFGEKTKRAAEDPNAIGQGTFVSFFTPRNGYSGRFSLSYKHCA